MAKDLTKAELVLRKNARGLAEAAGKTWANLSREERHAFVRQARRARPDERSQSGSLPTIDQAVQEKARAAAAMAGKNWADLSREERQNYLAQANKQNG